MSGHSAEPPEPGLLRGAPGQMRLPRLRRCEPDHLRPFRLTQRDAEIVEAVYHYRALTTPQIQALFFPATRGGRSNSRCQLRLQTLFHTGYLTREELPTRLSEGRRPLVYRLDWEGAQLVARREGVEIEQLDWSPRERSAGSAFLDHLLATNQVRIALVLAARAQSWSIVRWIDDRALKREQAKHSVTLLGPKGGKERAAVVPDGYFVLDAGKHIYHDFLEMDLGTVTGEAGAWGRRDWRRKVAAYLEFARSGQYEALYQARKWRVLTVTTSQARLKNLVAATEKAGGKANFWFTTLDKLASQSILVEPIWQLAGREELRSLIW